MGKIKHLLLWLLLLIQLPVGAVQVSPQAKLSVLTCSPGREIYSVYGHTAIRLKDPAQGMDIVFNYGVFDSYEDNFALKFAQGQLDYELGVEDYGNFYAQYAYYGRGIVEQELNLSHQQVQELTDFLEHNYLPENREYRYHFFFDNCSSRVLDVLRDQLGATLELPPDGAPSMERGRTFRDLIHDYQKPIPWTDFGIDLVLGMPCDSVVKIHQEAFLPDYLKDVLDASTLGGESLVRQTRLLLTDKQTAVEKSHAPTAVISSVCLLLALALIVASRRGRGKVLRTSILAVYAVLGVVLLLMWVATDHDTTVQNFNVLMAPATLVAMAVRPVRRWARMVSTAAVVLFIVLWWAIPQDLPGATIPMALLVLTALTQPFWMGRLRGSGAVE